MRQRERHETKGETELILATTKFETTGQDNLSQQNRAQLSDIIFRQKNRKTTKQDDRETTKIIYTICVIYMIVLNPPL